VSEALGQSPAHAYLVAGGGGGMRSTIILRMLAEELTERKIPYTAIEGIQGTGKDQRVHVPSQQVHDMLADIAERPKDAPILLIAHCIGTVAGLQTLEKIADERPAGLVAIAPPLPSPLHTIMTPQSSKKRSKDDTLMRVVDLPPGAVDYSVMTESQAHLSPQYFADIAAADDLAFRLRARVELGNAAAIAPEYDWNVESPRTVADWHKKWQHIAPADELTMLKQRAVLVPNAAHGLYISPRSGMEITPEADTQFQAQNVNHAVDVGLELIAQR